MKRPVCPKCSGFVARVDHPFVPGYEVKCMICGWGTVRPAGKLMPITAQMKAKVRYGDMKRDSCKVVGCSGVVYTLLNASGFCRKCYTAWNAYQHTNQHHPAPLLEVAGKWYRNPKSTVQGIKHVKVVEP